MRKKAKKGTNRFVSRVMQIASLKAPFISGRGLEARPSLRHLELETDLYHLLDDFGSGYMQAFPQLETLRMRSTHPSLNHLDLDLSHWHGLRHLHIIDWAPQTIMVSTRCQVQAVWSRRFHVNAHDWLLSPCWRAPGIQLISLVVEGEWPTEIQVHFVHQIIVCHRELEWLEIRSPRLGSEEIPIIFPAHYFNRFKSPLTVKISTTKGCWLYLRDAKYRFLIVIVEGPLHRAPRLL